MPPTEFLLTQTFMSPVKKPITALTLIPYFGNVEPRKIKLAGNVFFFNVFKTHSDNFRQMKEKHRKDNANRGRKKIQLLSELSGSMLESFN